MQFDIMLRNVMAGIYIINIMGGWSRNLDDIKFEALYSEEVNILANQGGG